MRLFKNIHNKLMVPTLFLTVSLMSVLGIFLAMNSFNGIKSMPTAKANSTADFISKVSVTSYKNFEYFDLDNYISEIKKDPEVDYAVFYDADGVALTKEAEMNTPSFVVVKRKINDETGKNLGTFMIAFNRSVIDSNLYSSLKIMSISIIAAIIIFLYSIRILNERVVIRRIIAMEVLSGQLTDGGTTAILDTSGDDEISSLGMAMNKMAANLKDLIVKTRSRNLELENWQINELVLKNGLNDLNIILRGDQKIIDFADRTLAFLISYLGAGTGIFYRYDENHESLQVISSYAITNIKRLNEFVHSGEGLVRQVLIDKKMICLDSVPQHYLSIGSLSGESESLNIVIIPVMYNELLTGVIEIGSFKVFSEADIKFLKQATDGIAIALNASSSRVLIGELLEQAQQQAEELRVQQEELQQSNEELAERLTMLKESKNSGMHHDH